MIKRISTNFDTVEMMLFIWQSIADKEKVADSFFIELANNKNMKYLYGEEFDEDSVRKVLSAISNREVLNNASKKERKFWNNNMWMLEDLDNMNNMVKPVKLLNLNDLNLRLNGETKFEEVEVIFIPGHEEEYYIDGNKLVINFFRLMVDFMDESKVTISGKPLDEYIEEKLLEMVK